MPVSGCLESCRFERMTFERGGGRRCGSTFCRWFRNTNVKGLLLVYRDLRLEDQTALITALRESDELAILWIYDDEAEGIPWSELAHSHSLRARLSAFKHFNDRLKTIGHQATLMTGANSEILSALKAQVYGFDAIYYNRFYDRAGKAMALAAQAMARTSGVSVSEFDDITLFSPTRILKKDGKPYQMFTPYYRQWVEHFRMAAPIEMSRISKPRARSVVLEGMDTKVVSAPVHPALEGGYEAMVAQWNAFLEGPLSRYSEDRDYPAK